MKIALGRQGEEIAAAYLQQQGYEILARNYRCRYGELDIICKKNNIIVFVEVKTRRSDLFGSPEEAITRTKIQHIKKVALLYLAENKTSCREIRFDVVTILMKADRPEINHIEAAF
ncbi:MAG: YraN family protein [Syntrophomonadaceae bacterium]|nr:YraN family protein [Syntrophomonadaceae bacterium]